MTLAGADDRASLPVTLSVSNPLLGTNESIVHVRAAL